MGVFLGGGRISEDLGVSLFPMGLSGIIFLSGELTSVRTPSPGVILCLGDGRFNLEGLTLSSEPRTG